MFFKLLANLVTESDPSAMLCQRETSCVVVNGGVVDVSKHVVSGDDVILSVVSFPPLRNARRTIGIAQQ